MGRRSIKDLKVDNEPTSKEGIFDTLIEVADQNPDMVELDLHSRDSLEAQHDIDLFIDKNFMAGSKVVRIIHGVGTGTLAKVVPEILKQNPHVAYLKTGMRSGTAVYAVLHQR
jgi:dsDNA-specific endonuclease/ATPase MutS2